MTDFKKLIAKAPNGPGVYKFLNDKKEPLYIGKAAHLKKRLQSYLRPDAAAAAGPSAGRNRFIAKMLELARHVEWIETNSEVESLILEDNLIKEFQPRYNIRLRDDKNFQYIRVKLDQDYPEIDTVRKIQKDHAKYFGPKTSGTGVRELMDSVRKIFKLCSVKNIKLDPQGTPLLGAAVAVKIGHSPARRPCLDYHIKRCTGPCAGMVTPAQYHRQVEAAVDFLAGHYKPAMEALKTQMADFATEKKFERAAALRDQIHAIERSAQKQLINDTRMPNRDVIAFVADLGKNYFVLFQIRSGKLIDQERFTSEGEGESPQEVMEAFLRDYYALAADIPSEIMISAEVEESKVLEAYIRAHTDHAVHLRHPQIGEKDDLIMLALQNARSFAEASRVSWEATEKRAEKALEELAQALKLPEPPKRIECYDISHLSGTETVGSMVVFKKGIPVNADYRQFRLRSTLNVNDDYKSMEEVITRRLNYLPAQLPEGYKIRKAKKGDFEFIERVARQEPINDEELEFKQFYLIEKKKKIIGFARLRSLDGKTDDIGSLWIAPEERGKKLGHHLIKKCIETSKQKRVYLDSLKKFQDYYLTLGFELLHQPPSALLEKIKRAKKRTHKPRHDFDPADIIYMAYQKKKRDFSFESRPDLIVIDGGKGQLGVAVDVLKAKGLKIPVISLAKKQEEVYVPESPDPLDLKSNSEASYLLQRIRDEAHRFAIEFNRGSREKKMTKSALDEIPGVGPKLKKRLLMQFGSLAGIKNASELELIPLVGPIAARKLKENL